MEEKNVANNAENNQELIEKLNACNALISRLEKQNSMLTSKIKELNVFSVYKRLDYLLEVVKHSEKFSPEFAGSCLEEFEKMMTLVENGENGNEEVQ